jgi:hypothetical protein
MTQAAVPIADDYVRGWSPTPVSAQIKPPGSGGVTSAPCLSLDTFIVRLSAVARPGKGPQTVVITLGNNDPNDLLSATVNLLGQGGTIASWQVQPPLGLTTYSFTLTDDQVQQITDYTNLRLLVSTIPDCSSSSSSSSGPEVIVPCCPNPIPATLSVTFFGATNNCACLDGTSTTITWNPVSSSWEGSVGVCGGTNQLFMRCVGPGPTFLFSVLAGSGFGGGTGWQTTANCDPFVAVFSAPTLCAVSDGSYLIAVTK